MHEVIVIQNNVIRTLLEAPFRACPITSTVPGSYHQVVAVEVLCPRVEGDVQAVMEDFFQNSDPALVISYLSRQITEALEITPSDMTVYVNCPPIVFNNNELFEGFWNILQGLGKNLERLCLELTEGGRLSDHGLRRFGIISSCVRVFLDDVMKGEFCDPEYTQWVIDRIVLHGVKVEWPMAESLNIPVFSAVKNIVIERVPTEYRTNIGRLIQAMLPGRRIVQQWAPVLLTRTSDIREEKLCA